MTLSAGLAFPSQAANLASVWTTFSGSTFGGSPSSSQTDTLTVSVSVDDGLDVSTFEFQITVNNPVSAIGTPSPTTAVTGHDYSLVIDDSLFQDLDGFSTVTITCSPPSFLTFSGSLTKTLSATNIASSVSASSPYSIVITATDPYGESDTHTFNLIVTANSAPSGTIPNQIAYVGEAFSYDFAGLITDANSDAITYTVTNTFGISISWLSTAPSGDSSTLISGTPAVSDHGSESVRVSASDGIDTTQVTFTITIRDVPRLNSAISDQTGAQVGHAYSYTFTSNTFVHLDSLINGYSAVYAGSQSLSGTWLSLNSGTRTFSGTPGQTDVGDWFITLTATDSNGKTGSDTFKLTVDLNNAPTYSGGLAD